MKGGSGIDYGSQHGNQLVSAKLLQYGNGKGVPRDLSPAGASRTVSAHLLCSLHRRRVNTGLGQAVVLLRLGARFCIEIVS